ncbi:hypothetical protein ALI22I_45870 [Saccharothrix sp. ALI-22-I]|uniref:hypothetical protein n=1 Tax=Saccharothrix sp. ALI-22-I TaxID=1933778 RepID=UPI00097BBA32|nr:hypothetical protein [Saccharothrix sp. ALI-22-I]ONI80599.1 hypothetical protein ALI22I_45870 [Saccharothrix sp. ALI-22-I]
MTGSPLHRRALLAGGAAGVLARYEDTAALDFVNQVQGETLKANLTEALPVLSPASPFNNYRQSGGGNFPHIAAAPVLHNRQLEIRQLIIEWVQERGEIDPAAFHRTDWRLVVDGTPVVVG